jgi:serine/threonine-protein kinase
VAETRLEAQGFKVGKVDEVKRAESPAGTVLEQDPLPGKADESCSLLTLFCSKPAVDLTVSSGPGKAQVPSTAGEPVAKATSAVEEAGFQVLVSRVNSAKVEEGLVIHSEPSGGTTATEGSTVTLTVSSGPKLAKVPILVEMQRSVAVQKIRSVGLVPSVSEKASPAPVGQVLRQTPSAGSQVPPDSSVSIVVSEGEEQARVPNVIGKLRAEAVSAVREAGLTPNVSEQETEVPAKIGRVTDQFPPPGSEVEPGSTVTVVVGKKAKAVPEEEFEE